MSRFIDPRDRDAKLAKQQEKKELLDRAFNRIIGSQLSKISSHRTTNAADEDEYRYNLEQERELASKRKRKKFLSKEHQELSKSTGLSAQVVALMAGTNATTKKEKDDNDNGIKKRKKKKKKKTIMHYDYDDYCNDFYENIDMENNDIAVAIFLSHHDTQEPVDTHNVEDKKQKTTSKTPPNNINARGVTMLKARYVQATILLKNQVEQQQGSEEFNIVNESNPTSAKFRPTKPNDETNQETTTNQQQANQLRSERLKDRNRKQCSFQIVTLLRNQLRRQILKDRNRHYNNSRINQRKRERLKDRNRLYYEHPIHNQKRSERLKDRNRQ
mmetsp:Transcript_2256/g.2558  ORF Transcript_2256/g.2558 Transcript_2256/m.2558 type:complete len:329 (-) Transcript_2256:25-1011(-)